MRHLFNLTELCRLKSGEVWVCTRRAARNLSYQGFMEEEGNPAVLHELTGLDILGLELAAPLAHHASIYTLPMLTIKASFRVYKIAI